MKKLISLICIIAMSTMILAGCGSSDSSDSAGSSDEEVQTYSVGIIQMAENGAFNDMREGFIQELRDQGYSEDVLTIDYQCAQSDATNLQTIAQSMVDNNYDLICTIATPATQAVVNLESDIPVIFIAVSAPETAGVVTDMDNPDKNATGTCNAIPVSDIFELAYELTPDMCGTFGFVYCTSEVNSVDTIDQAKEYCDANGISYIESTVTNSSEVQQAVQNIIDRVDAIFVPNDSVIQAAMTLITEIARDARVPVYGSSATMVDSGAFATVAISDTGIGVLTADMAIEILEGTDVADIPVQVVPASDTVINNQTLEALGVDLPEDIVNTALFVDDAE